MALYQVVSFEGSNEDWLIYKYPKTEFNTKSKLIVTLGQVAILVHNGKIERICEEGTFVLDTEFLPFVKTFVKSVHSGSNPYPMEVYFINKRIKLDFLWGTSDPVVILDPKYNIQLHLRARGQLQVKLTKYQNFLEKKVGSLMSNSLITFDILKKYLRGIINQKIRKTLTDYIYNEKISYYEINTHLDSIQAELERTLREEIEEFGIDMYSMSIESINTPESDLKTLNEILHKKAEYDQLGDNLYRTTRGYDVLEEGAKNNGATGSIIGVGMGLNATATGNTSNIIPPMESSEASAEKTITCPHCSNKIKANAKFCPECGNKVQQFCPNCGSSVAPNAKFCPECGSKL